MTPSESPGQKIGGRCKQRAIIYETPRQLRPCGANILQYSPAVLNFSRSAFCHASPTIWNNLPETVISGITVSTDTFKSRLKTALQGAAKKVAPKVLNRWVDANSTQLSFMGTKLLPFKVP